MNNDLNDFGENEMSIHNSACTFGPVFCHLVAAMCAMILLPSPSPSRAQSAPPVKRQCGTQLSNPQLNGYFWGFPGERGEFTAVKRMTVGASRIEIKVPIVERKANVFPAEPQLSRDGRTMIFLTVDNRARMWYDYSDAIVALNVVTADGTWLTFPASSDWKRWFQLGPELKPGHFGVLSIEEGPVLMLSDISWTGKQLQVTALKRLPFLPFRKGTSTPATVFIAPSWEFIGYIDSPTETFRIYSMQEQRVIWADPDRHMWDAGSGVSWVQDKEIAGYVNSWKAGGGGKLTALDRNSQFREMVDPYTALSANVYIAVSSALSPKRQLAVTVDPAVSDGQTPFNYFLLDVDTGQLTDLCLRGFPYFLAWDSLGSYLIATESDDSLPGYRIVVIYPQTGDYSYLYLSDNSVYPIAWVPN
jgi:hypothetical protein